MTVSSHSCAPPSKSSTALLPVDRNHFDCSSNVGPRARWLLACPYVCIPPMTHVLMSEEREKKRGVAGKSSLVCFVPERYHLCLYSLFSGLHIMTSVKRYPRTILPLPPLIQTGTQSSTPQPPPDRVSFNRGHAILTFSRVCHWRHRSRFKRATWWGSTTGRSASTPRTAGSTA